MTKYALTETSSGNIREIREFGDTIPPILNINKNAQWVLYIPPVPVPPTQAELDAIAAAEALAALKAQLLIDAKADAAFTALSGKTLAEINTFVNNQFGSMTVAQRNFLKVLASAASLYLQDR